MTRGSVYFYINDTGGRVEEVAKMGIYSDAYPSGAGQDLIDAIDYCEFARTPERLVLRILAGLDIEPHCDRGYVYIITMRTKGLDDEIRINSDWISNIKVTRYDFTARNDEMLFDGSYPGFKVFCAAGREDE